MDTDTQKDGKNVKIERLMSKYCLKNRKTQIKSKFLMNGKTTLKELNPCKKKVDQFQKKIKRLNSNL
jgi:hypothetical protein